MAVAYGATSAVPTGTSAGTGVTSVTSPLPTLNNGDMCIMWVQNKDDGATPSTPSGWTLGATVAGGFGASGNGTGATRLTVFYREKDAGWSTMPLVTVTGGTATVGMATTATKGTGSWDLAFSTGAKSDANATAYSATGTTDPGLTAGDLTMVGISIGDDIPTFSTQTLSATGVSAWGTLTERAEADTSRGGDLGLNVFDRGVTTGTSSAAPVVGVTISAAHSGPFILVRLREVPAVTPISASDTASLAISDSSSFATVNVSASDTIALKVKEGPGAGAADATLLTAGSDTTNTTTTYTTESISPTAGSFVYAFVMNSASTAPTPAITLSGNGLTWNLVTSTVASASKQMHLFAADAVNTTPTSGPVTITGDSVITATSCHWHIIEVNNVDDAVTDGINQHTAATATATSNALSFDVEVLTDGAVVLASGYSPVVETFTVTGDGAAATELAETSNATPDASSVSAKFVLAPSEYVGVATITGDSAQSVLRRALAAEIAVVPGGTTGDVEIQAGEPISGTDTSSLAISETSSIAVSMTRTDTASLAISDTSSFATVAVSGSDTASLAIAESNVIAGSGTASDTASLTITESAQVAVAISASDTASLAVADTSAFGTIPITGSDTSSLTISDSSSFGTVAVAGSDTASLAISEASVAAGTGQSNDSISLTITESTSTFVTLSATDTASLAIGDTSAFGTVSVSGSDTASLAVAETTQFATVAVSGSDTAGISLTDTASTFVNAPGQDTASLIITESANVEVGGVVDKTASDTASLSIADAGTIGTSKSASDTASIAISDTSDLSVSGGVDKTASDTGSITVTDASSVLVTGLAITGTDTSSLAVTESNDIQISGLVIKSSDDTLTIGISENGEAAVQTDGSDTASIAITETSDVQEVLLTPGVVKAYVGGSFVPAVMRVYHNGAWQVANRKRYVGGTWV